MFILTLNKFRKTFFGLKRPKPIKKRYKKCLVLTTTFAHRVQAHQGHGLQHGEAWSELEPVYQLEVLVQADGDLVQGGSELKVGGQADHSSQGHEMAQQGCGSV